MPDEKITLIVDVPTESHLYDIENRDLMGDGKWYSIRLFRNPFGSPNKDSVIEIMEEILSKADDGMEYRVVEYTTMITKRVLGSEPTTGPAQPRGGCHVVRVSRVLPPQPARVRDLDDQRQHHQQVISRNLFPSPS